MSDVLELGKHGLAEHGGAELLQEVVQQVGLGLLVILELLQQVAHHDRLVAGGRDLRHEEAVIALGGGLVGVGVEGMHGVTQLMGDGEGVGQVVVVVEQHIGVDVAQPAGGERAGRLVLRGEHVDPAAGACLAELVQVILTHGGQTLQHHIEGLVIGQFHLEVADHGGVQVVHVQLVQLHGFLAQGQVFVQRGNGFVDDTDKVVVDLLGDLQGFHLGRAAGGILTGASSKDVLVHIGGVGSSDGVGELAVGAHDALEALLADVAVLMTDEGGVGALGQGVMFAVRGDYIRELHVHVGQHGEDIVGCTGQLAHHGHELFLLLGQGMGLLTQQTVNEGVVVLHLRVGGDLLQGSLVHRQQLRL